MILTNPSVKAFLAVVKYGTVSEAGKQIGLTQTAVTQRIRSFESDIGVSLFIRSKSGMQLTDEGKLVFRHCLSANEIDAQLQSQVRQIGVKQEVEVNFAGMSSAIYGRVIPHIGQILENWPALNINFHIETHEDRLNLLKSGAVDLAILREHEVIPELESKPLRPLEFKLLASTKWKGRKLKEILKNERMLTYSQIDIHSHDYLDMYALHQHVERKKTYTNENRTFQSQIEHGLGYGLLPLELAESAIKEGKLFPLNSGNSIKHPISLAWYRRWEMPPYMKDIIESIR